MLIAGYDMKRKTLAIVLGVLASLSNTAFAVCPFDQNCLNNPYGSGNPYKADGLMNPFSGYGNSGSVLDNSNSYGALQKLGAESPIGNYRYGNPYSPDSPGNPYGAGNPYNGNKVYVWPAK